jgi:hypothetical protein
MMLFLAALTNRAAVERIQVSILPYSTAVG